MGNMISCEFILSFLTTSDWMNEGGQSSTGQLLDFIIDVHCRQFFGTLIVRKADSFLLPYPTTDPSSGQQSQRVGPCKGCQSFRLSQRHFEASPTRQKSAFLDLSHQRLLFVSGRAFYFIDPRGNLTQVHFLPDIRIYMGIDLPWLITL
jgi:hypothetical protein